MSDLKYLQHSYKFCMAHLYDEMSYTPTTIGSDGPKVTVKNDWLNRTHIQTTARSKALARENIARRPQRLLFYFYRMLMTLIPHGSHGPDSSTYGLSDQ